MDDLAQVQIPEPRRLHKVAELYARDTIDIEDLEESIEAILQRKPLPDDVWKAWIYGDWWAARQAMRRKAGVYE